MAAQRSPPIRRAWSSLGSLVSGLLHRSIVFATIVYFMIGECSIVSMYFSFLFCYLSRSEVEWLRMRNTSTFGVGI